MRKWFQQHFEQMNAVLENHEYFWKGVPETILLTDEEQVEMPAPAVPAS